MNKLAQSVVIAFLFGMTFFNTALANDTQAIMGMVNKAMRDAYSAADPSTSMEEVRRIGRHYGSWAARNAGSVSALEMRNGLAQRHYWEQARRQREIAISNTLEAQRRAKAVQDYTDSMLGNR